MLQRQRQYEMPRAIDDLGFQFTSDLWRSECDRHLKTESALDGRATERREEIQAVVPVRPWAGSTRTVQSDGTNWNTGALVAPTADHEM
jgi:hypothetical protein